MLANCLLIRYAGGLIYLDHHGADRRRETYLELGNIADRDTAIALGNRLLTLHAEHLTTVTVEGPALDDATSPGSGYALGDTLDGHLLTGYTITLANDGMATVVPELGDAYDARLSILDRQITRLNAGNPTEYARPAINYPRGAGTDTNPPEFSQDQTVVVSIAPLWRAPRPWWGAWLDVSLGTPGVGPTRVTVARYNAVSGPGPTFDFVAVATATFGAGQRRALARINQGWAAGDALLMAVTAADGVASSLTATLRGTMV